jgi:predicted XRE-type DNA-binding protein
MAFTTIPSSIIQVGKAIKKALFQYTKDNFDDHESRIANLEINSTLVQIINETIYCTSRAATLTGVLFYKAQQNIRIVKVELQIFEKGSISTGTVSVDLKKGTSLNPISFTSIMTTEPEIDYAVDPDFTSDIGTINGILNEVDLNEFVRVDITSLPATPVGKIRVIVTAEIN